LSLSAFNPRTSSSISSDPAKKTGWKLLGDEDGTGESIVFFYRSESDQKVFFWSGLRWGIVSAED
jgi:hypothetical protein